MRSRRAGRPRSADRARNLAEHQPKQTGLGRLLPWRLSGDAALAHDDDPVGAGHDFMQLVGDEDDGVTVRLELGDRAKKTCGLRRRQNLCRLVEDQDARAGKQLFENLDLLPVADRQSPDRQVKIDIEPEPRGEALHAGAQAGGPDDEREVIEKERDILPDRERRDQAEVLENHADPETARRARGVDRRIAAGDYERAGVGPVIAIKDLAERALARAILAEQSDNLARDDGEFGDVVGEQRAEALDDASGLDERRHRSPSIACRQHEHSGMAQVIFAGRIVARLASPAAPCAGLQRRAPGSSMRE